MGNMAINKGEVCNFCDASQTQNYDLYKVFFYSLKNYVMSICGPNQEKQVPSGISYGFSKKQIFNLFISYFSGRRNNVRFT